MAAGFNQINNPTPAWANWAFRIVLYVAALGNIYVTIFTQLPPDIKDLIVGISSFVTIATHMASKMFGVPIPDGASIPASEVDTLNTNTPDITTP